MIDDLTTVVGIGTMIGIGRGKYSTHTRGGADKTGHPGETMTTTDDVMIETDETIDEMTDEMIDTSERDPSGKLSRYERCDRADDSPVGGERRARVSPAYEDRRPAYRDQDEPVPKGDAPPRY
jgi:hypothetical protein